MVKNILFDFDGTLVNTNEIIFQSWQHTYRTYLGHEMPEKHITNCFGEPLLITMEREFPGVDPEESAEVYRAFQQEHAGEYVSIFPGTVEMLTALREKGYRLGIVTSRTRESTDRYLDQFGIQSFFYDIVSCEDTDIHKPNPEPLLLGMVKLGAAAEDSIMVGDSPFDIKCANNAGVRSVLVGWRLTADEISSVGKAVADYEIGSPMDLVELVERL